MASQSLQIPAPISAAGPLRDNFPRLHLFCDRCDAPLGGLRESGSIETPAGCFRYAFCDKCCDARRKMSKTARAVTNKRALVRHAMRYSPQFGSFVADWFGVKTKPAKTVQS